MKRLALVALATLASVTTAHAAVPPPVPADISLIEENGALIPRTSGESMPIYTFDRDGPGRPTCTGLCAQHWPAVLATPHSEPVGDWTLIPLSGGNAQWAFRGKPVYTHAGDAAGKPTGDGLDGAWHLVPNLPR